MNILLTIVAAAIILFVIIKMMKVIIRIALVALLFILAYLTNPDLEDHRRAVQKKTEDSSGKIREEDVHIRDCKVFSITKIKQAEKESWVGIGAFTKVWIFRSLPLTPKEESPRATPALQQSTAH